MSPRYTSMLVAMGWLMVSSGVLAQQRVLYTNARVITQDPAMPRAAALLVEGDRIQRVYARVPAQRPTGARQVDLKNAVVVPGLADAHLHLTALGAKARQVDLRGTRSAGEAVARVKDFVNRGGAGEPIIGFGWDHNDWTPRAFPERGLLDAALGNQVVILYRIDGHAAWVSTAALAVGGIARDRADPDGGRIVRDGKGDPSGVLVDNAIDLVTGSLPRLTQVQLEHDVALATRECARLGLTQVHDMGSDVRTLQALRALEARHALPLRVFVYLAADDPDATKELNPQQRRRTASRVEVRGLKLYTDGALGSRGAALKQPYSDDPGNSGLLVTEPKILHERVRQVHEAGYQVAIHAIGDRGNREALDAIGALGKGGVSRRHRIEHAQIVDPADIPLFKQLGVIASMQPTHATSDMDWAEARLGPDRLAGAYAWKTMLSSGVALAFGSDAPVESADPTWGLFAATQRTDHDGAPKGGWLPGEKLSPDQALAGFTSGAAYAVGREDELGVLRAGALADFTVLDGDPADPATRLLHLKVLRTVVGGEQAFPPTTSTSDIP
ncbi:MAG: amidohydrolase [Pseudomonadota bacterium]